MKKFATEFLVISSLATIVATFSSMAWAGVESGKAAYDNGNYAVALQELNPLAESENATAQTLLGTMYARGQGVEKNEAKAVFWYSKASTNGDADAQLNLADMFANGRGVKKNDALAAYWRWRAAYAFTVIAKNNLDVEYATKIQAAASAQADQTSTAGILVVPSVDLKQCKLPRYPAEAMRLDQRGIVRLLLLIDKDGKVLDASVDTSSGFPILDQAALASFSSCGFQAGTFNGEPAMQLFKMEYAWVLNHQTQ